MVAFFGPLRCFLGQAAPEQAAHRLRCVVDRDRFQRVLVAQQIEVARRAVGRPAGEALEERGGGGVDVGLRARRRARPLLRRHVGGCAGEGAVRSGAGGDAEVGQLAVAVGVDEHVFRLVVAVDDPVAVRRRQAEQRALEHEQRGFRLDRALFPHHGAHRDAVDEFHHDRGVAAGLDVFVQLSDVRAFDLGENVRLGPEVGDEALVER